MAHSLLFGRIARHWRGFAPVDHTLWALEAGVLHTLYAATGNLAVERASALGARVGAALGPRLRKHRHARANYACAFPERTPAELEALVRAMWTQAGRVLAEFPHVPELAVGRLRERVEIVDGGGLELVCDHPGGVLMVGAHLGNWYMALALARRLGERHLAIFREQTNPYIERLFARWRRRLPVRFAAVGGAGTLLARELRAGRRVGVLLDQRYDGGEPIPFFGRPALTATPPLRLALRLGAPIVPVETRRLEGVHFQVIVHPPLMLEERLPAAAGARVLATRLNRIFEGWIRAAPGQWFCLKRRFPKERKGDGGGPGGQSD